MCFLWSYYDKCQRYFSGRTHHRHCDASGNTAWMLYPINMAAETRHRRKMCGNRPQIDSNASDLVCSIMCVLFDAHFFYSLLLSFKCFMASKCFLFPLSLVYRSAESGHIWTVWREYLCFSFPLLMYHSSSVLHLSSVITHLFPSYGSSYFIQRGLRKSLTLCLTSKGRAREGQPDQDAVWASRAVHNRNGKECCAHRGAEETGKER